MFFLFHFVNVLRKDLIIIINLQTRLKSLKNSSSWHKGFSIFQPLKRRRRYLSAVALNNRLYAIGGYDASSRLNTVECFDPSTSQWTVMTPMLQRRGLAGATTSAG